MDRTQISGLTIAKNVVSREYPLTLSFETVKSLFDELVIVYGRSKDGTLDLLNELSIEHGNVRIIEVNWKDGDPNELGRVTNIGLRRCSMPWVYYFQADEFADKRLADMIHNATQQEPNSYLFPYVHFAGDINHIQSNPPYRDAIRLFRNKKYGVSSDTDAWSFTGFKIYSAFQINRIFPTTFLNYPIYHAHGFTRNVERETARADSYETGRRLEYSGFVPPELVAYSNLLQQS